MSSLLHLIETAALLAGTTLGIGLPWMRRMQELSLAEVVAWAVPAGLLPHAFLYLLLTAIGRPSSPLLLALDGALAVGLWVSTRSPEARRDGVVATRGERLWLGLALAGGLVFGLLCLARPISSVDFLAIWGWKGKVVFSTGGLSPRIFDAGGDAYWHPEYPILLPVLYAATNRGIGVWDDRSLALLDLFFFAATILALASSARRFWPRRHAALAVALAAWAWPLYRGYQVGLAEIPLAMGIMLASTALIESLEGGNPGLARALVAGAWCAGLKQEGSLFAILVAAGIVLWGRGARRILFASTLAGTVVVAGIALRMLRGPLHDRDFSFAALRDPGELVRRVAAVSTLVGRQLAGPVGLVLLLAAGAVLLGASSRGTRALCLLLSIQAAAYLAACALSFDPAWQFDRAVGRILAALLPASALVLSSLLAPVSGHEDPVGVMDEQNHLQTR
jgi:hypothetical protein